jgi:lysine---8-amino-7-oxononanoate aminotransferase
VNFCESAVSASRVPSNADLQSAGSQRCNLLRARTIRVACRLQTCDTADCKSALPRTRERAWTGTPLSDSLFACHHEGVRPDFLALAKGLTGGYLPMAATLTTQAVFDAFLGEYDEFKTFFHGHSFTANQLGAAAALASLDLLQSPASLQARHRLEQGLRDELKTLWELPHIGDLRQVGLIVGVELVRDWRTRVPFDLREQAGIRICRAMAKRGVLTRPIGNVVVLMPPYCTTPAQARRMVAAIREAVVELEGTRRNQIRNPKSERNPKEIRRPKRISAGGYGSTTK